MGVNTDIWIYQRWDQVPKRSKHPLVAPAMNPISNAKISSQNQCVQIRQTEQSVFKISAFSQVNGKIRSENQCS
jgi:hypothetical protein